MRTGPVDHLGHLPHRGRHRCHGCQRVQHEPFGGTAGIGRRRLRGVDLREHVVKVNHSSKARSRASRSGRGSGLRSVIVVLVIHSSYVVSWLCVVVSDGR